MKEIDSHPTYLNIRDLGFSILNKLNKTQKIPSDLIFEIDKFSTKLIRLSDVARSIEQYLNDDIEENELKKELEFYNTNKTRYNL